MNTEVNEMVLAALKAQSEPIERRDLQILSEVLEINKRKVQEMKSGYKEKKHMKGRLDRE